MLNIDIYDEQLLGVLSMLDGYFSEINTGEGKTYISCFLALLNIKKHKKIYIITINNYLAKRDYIKCEKIFEFFNVKATYNDFNYTLSKQEIYNCNLIYTSSKELIFDYLRNNHFEEKDKYNISLDYAIIDEVDFVLIDNANTSFTLSIDNPFEDRKEVNIVYYKIALDIIKKLNKKVLKYKTDFDDYVVDDYDYIVSMFDKTCIITKKGMNKIENFFGISSIEKCKDLYKIFTNTIIANDIFVKNVDYVIKNNKIIFIDKNNGRLMYNSRREAGIQISLELKENIAITNNSGIKDSISYQVFFNKFNFITGMSGTLIESQNEFKEIYNHNCIKINTHFKNITKNNGIMYFKNNNEKMDYLLYKINILKNKSPILIICNNEEEVINIRDNLLKNNIKSSILNSYNIEEEESIIKNCGVLGNITITTNLMGRGTDIKLSNISKLNGGMYLIGFTRFYNKRIEQQIIGRVGRQGDPGKYEFLASLDDEIFNNTPSIVIDKLIKLSDKDFYSKKYQKKIDNLILKNQQILSSKYYNERKRIFIISSVLNLQKEYLLQKGTIFFNCNLNDFFYELINTQIKYNMIDDCNVFFGLTLKRNIRDLNNEEVEGLIEDILKKINEKIDKIGAQLSRKTLFSIFRYMLYGKWDMYSEILKRIVESEYFNKKEEVASVEQFILKSKNEQNYFINYIYTLVLEYFLEINIEK